ncbi:MAG: heparinase II/III family protein [Candidatus Nanopelagicales bacterium]
MRSAVTLLVVLGLCAGVSPAVADESPSPTVSESPTASPTPTTTTTVTPGPYSIPLGQNIREDAWCRLLVPNKKGDAAEADSIMQNKVVDLGQYGTYKLNGKWNRQSTADSSGNDHINGLYWAVPLLYTGARRADAAMVQRFFDLIGDWLGDHRKKKTRTWSVTQPIIAGERLWTLTCAADVSNGARFVKATRKEAVRQVDGFKIGGGTNNTGLHSQGSALAAFCYLGDTARRDQAAANLDRLANYLVLADGSDREGSPWYAFYTLRLMNNLRPIYDRCGLPFDTINAAILRSEQFLAAAVDPNFNLVMTGDTMRASLTPKWFAPGSEARWAATKGTEGQPPGQLFETFSGGYVFGRNSWTDIDGHRPTFFSVRSARPFVTAHVHNDLGSVTFNSYGAEFVGDPGPYRYDNSAIRDYMVSRSGHSVIRVTTLKPKKQSKKSSAALSRKRSAALEPYDRTCLTDRTYIAARISRCVYYDSGIDGLVVVDSVKARKRIKIDQRWQVPSGVTVAASGTGATLTTKTAAARMLFSGGGKVSTERGWFTQGYGEVVKGTVLQRSRKMAKGTSRTWVSVLAAGDQAPEVSLTDGTVAVARKGSTSTFTIP